MSSNPRANARITKENSHEGITWSEIEKQSVQAEKVYWNLAVAFVLQQKVVEFSYFYVNDGDA